MPTLAELLKELDGTSSPVEKTAAAAPKPYTKADIDQMLVEHGLVNQKDLAIEKVASSNGGGKQVSSLYEAVTEMWAAEEAAAGGTTTPVEATEIEKIAASNEVQEVVDWMGKTAGEYFNEIFQADLVKVASEMGISPEPSTLFNNKGAATGMFGETGEARVETNRPANSEKHVDTSPKYYTMDHAENSVVGMAMKKKVLSKAIEGRK